MGNVDGGSLFHAGVQLSVVQFTPGGCVKYLLGSTILWLSSCAVIKQSRVAAAIALEVPFLQQESLCLSNNSIIKSRISFDYISFLLSSIAAAML